MAPALPSDAELPQATPAVPPHADHSAWHWLVFAALFMLLLVSRLAGPAAAALPHTAAASPPRAGLGAFLAQPAAGPAYPAPASGAPLCPVQYQ